MIYLSKNIITSQLFLHLIGFISTVFLLTSCGQSKAPLRQGPPQIFDPKTIEVPQFVDIPKPKVNIVFVIDNSGSMDNYQLKLASEMKRFSSIFFNYTEAEYRLAVVPIYDSKYLNDTTVYGPSNSGKYRGLRKMNPLGELVELKDSSPRSVFITNETPNPSEELTQLVHLGVQWGPEAEESFSPVLALLDPTINKEKNQDFYQENNYLVVIFLTDADDVTPNLSADEFYSKLVAAKKGDRNKILIAAALPNPTNNSQSCSKDGSGPIEKFPKLLSASRGTLIDLCSDSFGNDLAQFATSVVSKISEQKVELNQIPDLKSLKVVYGIDCNQSKDPSAIVLERGADKDYIFNPENNVIKFTGRFKSSSQNIKSKTSPNSHLIVCSTPTDLRNMKNGRAKSIY